MSVQEFWLNTLSEVLADVIFYGVPILYTAIAWRLIVFFRRHRVRLTWLDERTRIGAYLSLVFLTVLFFGSYVTWAHMLAYSYHALSPEEIGFALSILAVYLFDIVAKVGQVLRKRKEAKEAGDDNAVTSAVFNRLGIIVTRKEEGGSDG